MCRKGSAPNTWQRPTRRRQRPPPKAARRRHHGVEQGANTGAACRYDAALRSHPPQLIAPGAAAVVDNRLRVHGSHTRSYARAPALTRHNVAGACHSRQHGQGSARATWHRGHGGCVCVCRWGSVCVLPLDGCVANTPMRLCAPVQCPQNVNLSPPPSPLLAPRRAAWLSGACGWIAAAPARSPPRHTSNHCMAHVTCMWQTWHTGPGGAQPQPRAHQAQLPLRWRRSWQQTRARPCCPAKLEPCCRPCDHKWHARTCWYEIATLPTRFVANSAVLCAAPTATQLTCARDLTLPHIYSDTQLLCPGSRCRHGVTAPLQLSRRALLPPVLAHPLCVPVSSMSVVQAHRGRVALLPCRCPR